MENFDFHVTTDIRFGKDRLAELPEVLNHYGKRVLLVYGGGSIKKIGLYDKVMDQLRQTATKSLSFQVSNRIRGSKPFVAGRRSVARKLSMSSWQSVAAQRSIVRRSSQRRQNLMEMLGIWSYSVGNIKAVRYR